MSRTNTATLFLLSTITAAVAPASASTIVSAGHIEVDATLYPASSGALWHEIFVRLDVVNDGSGQKVHFPDSFCAKYGFPMTNGKCLRDPMSPDGFVISMSCIDETDNGVQSVITPIAESYRVRDRQCDQRLNQQDSGTLAFGDTCMHPNVTGNSLGTTLTYFHEEAQNNNWQVPQLSSEHTFSCRWRANKPAPVVNNPKIVFYIQNWEKGTSSKANGEDYGFITEGGHDFGQIEVGNQDSYGFQFRNIGWDPLTFDTTTGISIAGPSGTMTVSVPQFGLPNGLGSRHNFHSEPPPNIIGRGGRLDFSAEVNSQTPGATEHFTITATPTNPSANFFNPAVHLWYTPVASCTPEIKLGNFGQEWIGLLPGQDGTLSAKLYNRGCTDLTVANADVDGQDASHFSISDVLIDGSSIGATNNFKIPAKGSGVVKVLFSSPGGSGQFLADLVIESDSIDVGSPMAGIDPYCVGGVSSVKLEVSAVP